MSSQDINTMPDSELLAQVIDTNATGIIILDKDNNLVFWNKWFEKKSLLKKEDVLQKNLFSVFPELKNSRIHKAIGLSISKGNASFISHAFNKTPFPLYSDSDKKKPLRQLTYVKPVRLENNERYCFVQITDSSTAVYRENQLRKMAHEAEELSRLKSGFVSSVSHELRTPLTSIMGSIGLLQSGVEDLSSETEKKMMDIAFNNAERLLLLISDILDIEKIESGKMEFKFSQININNLVNECILQNEGLSKKYNVGLSFNKEDNLPLVYADKDRIFQVLNNLISNAAKFEPENSNIEIETIIEKKNIRVSIKDHGRGIPEAFKSRVFHAFSQADISNTKEASGTGLGLAISKTIIEHHDGVIDFDSLENQGTCFYFTLPINTDKININEQ